MGIRIMMFASCIAALTFSCGAHAHSRRHAYTPSQYLKNYALSACLARGYAGHSDFAHEDATIAAAGYVELGSFGIKAYREAVDLADVFLRKHYVSKSGKDLLLMKCIDFYHSQALDDLADKYERQD